MDTLPFLKSVLPSFGRLCIGTLSPSGLRHRYFDSVEELGAYVTAVAPDQTSDHYYCISSLKGSRRTQQEAEAARAVVFDIDVKPGELDSDTSYPSLHDAIAGLEQFLTSHEKLPDPTIVNSGTGLHIYWVFDRDLAIAEWQPIADGFKSLARESGFKIDPVVTGDSARLLRIPGTVNTKNNGLSSVVRWSDPVDPKVLIDCLAFVTGYLPPKQPGRKSVSPLTVMLANAESDIPPADPKLVYDKCQQVKWAVDNQGIAGFPEPLWYSLLGVAAYCEDPNTVAIEWSKNYPGFDPGETIDKMEHWKGRATGATTCYKFEHTRPSGCDGCPYQGNINSPIMLGVVTPELSPIELAQAPETAVDIPAPYKRTANGIRVVIDDVEIEICNFDIYPVSYGLDEALGYEVCRFHWNRINAGWRELRIRQALLSPYKTGDFATDIADQGILLTSRKSVERFQAMLARYMDELKSKKGMANYYQSMGWKNDHTEFVIGQDVYKRTNNGIEVQSLKDINPHAHARHTMWEPSGNIEAWTNLTKLLGVADLMPHMFAVGVSMSAPLYSFTGLSGVTVSLYGATGGGKSLAQLWAQSVWGHPIQLHFTANFTLNALFNRMGTFCHLPITVDEATNVPPNVVGDFLYWVTQGRDKARLNRNAQERETKEWATPTIISTNTAWESKLSVCSGDVTAQRARLLELPIDVHNMFSDTSDYGATIVRVLSRNYGEVGRNLIRMLQTMGPDLLRYEMEVAPDKFYDKYRFKFLGPERFWQAAIVLADYMLVKARELNMMQADTDRCIEWVLDKVEVQRAAVKESRIDAFAMLTDYLNLIADKSVVSCQIGGSEPYVDTSRVPRGEVRARYNLLRSEKAKGEGFTHGSLLIDQRHIKNWLAHAGVDWGEFKDGLGEALIPTDRSSRKASLTKGSSIKLPQVSVVKISLNHRKLRGILSDADGNLSNGANKAASSLVELTP